SPYPPYILLISISRSPLHTPTLPHPLTLSPALLYHTGMQRKFLPAAALYLFLLSACLNNHSGAAGFSPTLAPMLASPATGLAITPTLTSAPSDKASTTTPTPTSIPSPSPTVSVTCYHLEANWGNWPVTIDVLNQLIAGGLSCGPEGLERKLYAAHFNYAMALEAAGDVANAIDHYQAAFDLDPQRDEALRELARLDALPAPTPVPCQSDSPPNPDPAPGGSPDLSPFVTAQSERLMLDGQTFHVQGINYYPRHAPWHRFLEQSALAEIAAELDLIKDAGFGTLRVFLRYDPLFTCDPELAVPSSDGFARVDALFEMARARGFKLIVTLNDLPDHHFRPLYTDWPRYDAQTTYIVRRYRSEPAILAWDLRNEPDLDWGADGRPPVAAQEQVVSWLEHIDALVRANDPYHLITIGWWGDPTQTGPDVDVLSFHHWEEAADLAARIDDYRRRGNDKPLLLEEVGYHTWANAPQGARTPETQADILGRVVEAAEEKQLAGWLVWTAFDFTPLPGQPESHEHFFGLWTIDLTPKPALDAFLLP
ncbi:MAG: cellulase family glycosylhydrolase, partial [Anaerolineae bacterium]|nr:cellulase family glycosylhydrolase [Anaerolineae bacterium]